MGGGKASVKSDLRLSPKVSDECGENIPTRWDSWATWQERVVFTKEGERETSPLVFEENWGSRANGEAGRLRTLAG